MKGWHVVVAVIIGAALYFYVLSPLVSSFTAPKTA